MTSSTDWSSIIKDSRDSMIADAASDAAEDFLDVQFLGDDLLDIYGDAINEAAASDPVHCQYPLHQHHHHTIVSDEIPTLANNDSILNGFASLVAPSTTVVMTDKSESWVDKPSKKRKNTIETTPEGAAAASKKKRLVTPKRDSKKMASTPMVPIESPRAPALTSPQSPGTFTLTVSLPSSTLSSAGTADDEFKVHAQAAVTDFLEKNHKDVAQKKIDGEQQQQHQGQIDTSTEHVKALTADNWVAASSDLAESVCEQQSSSPNYRSRRADLTTDERAQQNRDRNREHARNTRLRKKAYVDELKKTLLEIVAQRDANDLAKKMTYQRDHDQREVRFRVIQEFLKLRGQNVADEARWSAILEDNFTFTLPTTLYRRMASQGCAGDKQIINGVMQSMADAENLSSFFQSLGEDVELHYKCDRQAFMMDGTSAFVEWEAHTVGAASETSFQGSVRCSFSPVTNKLLSVDMFFDTGIVAMKIGSQVAVTVGSASSSASISKEEDSSVEDSSHEEMSGRVPSTIELKSSAGY